MSTAAFDGWDRALKGWRRALWLAGLAILWGTVGWVLFFLGAVR